ncbi:hypothetical protein [Microbacterium sp. C448]|nr:hypothetical protein [Microbacterium sp. C448]
MSQRDLIFAVSTLIVGGTLVAFVVAWWRSRDKRGRDKRGPGDRD